jgi:hypothetical protein
MVSQQRSYLVCKNEDCCHTIWLPQPTQLDKFPDQLDSDNQYFEIFVCPACGHVYEYRILNTLWMFPRTEALAQLLNLRVVLLEFYCGRENPSTRVIIRKPSLEALDAAKLVAESNSWVLHDIHCPVGHLITELPPSHKRYANVLVSEI